MAHQLILEKLKRQLSYHPHPIVACIDFDGTLYTTSNTIWQTFYYNHKTSQLLDRFSIPFILVTGRANWTSMAEAELRFFGMKKADVVVTGAGTMIYYRNTHGELTPDAKWVSLLQKTIVTCNDGKRSLHKQEWNKNTMLKYIFSRTFSKNLHLSYEHDNEYTIRFHVRNMPVEILEDTKGQLEKLFPEGVKILIAEKLLQKNTLSLYSGDVLVVPSLAGKESAVTSILENYAQAIHTKVQGVIFGDSSVDIRMLSVPDSRYVTFSQYGVHLTPRAYRILQQDIGKNRHLHISDDDGPKIIYGVFKDMLKPAYYSPSQNNQLRSVLKPFEPVFNRIVYPRFSANELSFKGLELVIKGVDSIYIPSPTIYQKMKGFQYYLLGNSMDLFDGIRARQNLNLDVQGQLVDVFCDRAKEFYQLYRRAQQKFAKADGKEKGYQTLLTALSCILPSVARAAAERTGSIVAEKDTKGGSMFDRTVLLTRAFFSDVYGNGNQSLILDRKVYERNLATFYNRQQAISKKPKQIRQTTEQKKANVRLALLQNLLSEEHGIIVNTLSKYPSLYRQYQTECLPIIKPYLINSPQDTNSIFRLDKYIKISYM